MFALEKYMDITFANGQPVTELIKLMLPLAEVNAKKEWEKGLMFNDHRYFAWFSTTGGMKKEDYSGKCETFFNREDYVPFVKEFEQLISLGKFKGIEESREKICINKDVLSRLSLVTNSSYMAGGYA